MRQGVVDKGGPRCRGRPKSVRSTDQFNRSTEPDERLTGSFSHRSAPEINILGDLLEYTTGRPFLITDRLVVDPHLFLITHCDSSQDVDMGNFGFALVTSSRDADMVPGFSTPKP